MTDDNVDTLRHQFGSSVGGNFRLTLVVHRQDFNLLAENTTRGIHLLSN